MEEYSFVRSRDGSIFFAEWGNETTSDSDYVSGKECKKECVGFLWWVDVGPKGEGGGSVEGGRGDKKKVHLFRT